MAHLPQLRTAEHHGQNSRLVGLLVAALQGLRRFPAASLRNIGHREMLARVIESRLFERVLIGARYISSQWMAWWCPIGQGGSTCPVWAPLDKMRTTDPYIRARAKLSAAVIKLATGEGDVRWRLQSAYLDLVGTLASELPADLRKRLLRVQQRLTAKKSKYPWVAALPATLQRMRLKTGAGLAKEIISIEFDLRKASGRRGITG